MEKKQKFQTTNQISIHIQFSKTGFHHISSVRLPHCGGFCQQIHLRICHPWAAFESLLDCADAGCTGHSQHLSDPGSVDRG
jgi:hypothetical protein